ncbi:MAG: hypothetical protein NVS4B8_30540 [Herpetosiphon sp.]
MNDGQGERPARAVRGRKTTTDNERHVRQERAVELRIRGWSFRAIGAAIGVSHTQAIYDVYAALREANRVQRAKEAQLRQLECERLDFALRGLAEAVKAGDVLATERWLRISARRARLLGLDQPALKGETHRDDTLRVVIDHSGEGSTEERAPNGNS